MSGAFPGSNPSSNRKSSLSELVPGEGLGLSSRQTPQIANLGVIPGEQRAEVGMNMKDKRVVEAGMGGKLP